MDQARQGQRRGGSAVVSVSGDRRPDDRHDPGGGSPVDDDRADACGAAHDSGPDDVDRTVVALAAEPAGPADDDDHRPAALSVEPHLLEKPRSVGAGVRSDQGRPLAVLERDLASRASHVTPCNCR